MIAENIYAPFKLLTAKLRRSKRDLETEMAEILKCIINLKNNHQNYKQKELLQKLSKCKKQMKELQQKMKSNQEEQEQMLGICSKRVHHDQCEKDKSGGNRANSFDFQVVHFLSCRKKIEEAEKLAQTLSNGNFYKIFVSLYKKAFSIEDSISRNELRPLKQWCYDHSHNLAKIKSPLQFKLITCQYINILNNTGPIKAIQFLRKSVSTLTLEDTEKQEIKKLTYMLLNDPNEKQNIEYYSDEEKQEGNYISNIFPEEEEEKQQAEEDREMCQIKYEDPLEIQQRREGEGKEASERRLEDLNENVLIQAGTHIMMGAQRLIDYIAEQNQMPNNPVEAREEQIYEQVYEDLSSESEKDNNPQKQDENADDFPPVSILSQSLRKIEQQQQKQKQKEEQAKLKEQEEQKKKKRVHKLDKNNLRSYLKQTKQAFIEAFEKVYQIPFTTIFDKTLGMGISTIKTNDCCQSSVVPKENTRSCPACSPQLINFSRKIPMVHQNCSSLICRINGSMISEQNYPIALPNGQIYSKSGLQSIAKNGKYQCIISQKWFRKSECRKVFLS